MPGIGKTNTFISLLRGINVSGHNKIKMAELTDLYKSLGFVNVRTYVQSGNVVFNHNSKDEEKLSSVIEVKLKKDFGFQVKVLIRTNKDLQQILKTNPFIKHAEQDRLYVTFLSLNTNNESFDKEKIYKNGTDEFYIKGKEIFLHCPNGYGRTKLSNNYFEKELKAPATTRNWNTIQNLYELSKEN